MEFIDFESMVDVQKSEISAGDIHLIRERGIEFSGMGNHPLFFTFKSELRNFFVLHFNS